MDDPAVGTLVLVALLIAGLGLAAQALLYRKRLLTALRKLENHNRSCGKIPTGSKFFYEHYKGMCRRCNKGRITKRYRYQLVSGTEGGTKLRELTHVYRCTECSYRSIDLKKHK